MGDDLRLPLFGINMEPLDLSTCFQRNILIHASNILKPFHILRHSGTSKWTTQGRFKLWMGTVAKKRANCNSETWLYWSAQSRTCATFDVGKGGRMWGNHFPTSFANSWGGVKPSHICTSFIHENSDDDFFFSEGPILGKIQSVQSVQSEELGHPQSWWNLLVTLWWTNSLQWKDPPYFSWENPLFQWPFSIAFC